MTRLAIFDCDGTLVDSGQAICLAMETCFADAGLSAPTHDRTRRVVGLSLVEAMASLVPDLGPALHGRLADDYKRAFGDLRRRALVEEPLFAGIRSVLDTLVADGWQLGIATGKSDRGLAACLNVHGIADLFVTRQTADRHPSKPDPSMVLAALREADAEPEDAVVIGDTSFDMMMARAAGVRAIGVGWGYHPAHELLVAGADAIADAPSDLLSLLRVPA